MDVSIIIPYNRDRGLLRYAIESAKAQKFSGKFEVLPIHGRKYTLGQNSNIGLKRAQGKYIKFLSEDDMLPPDSIQLLYDFCEARSLDWAMGNSMNFGNKGEVIYRSDLEALRQGRNSSNGGATMYRRGILLKIGGYDESLWTAEELDLHLKLLSLKYRVDYIDAVVYKYRTHCESKSYQYRNRMHLKYKKKREQLIKSIKAKYRNG